MARIYSLMLYLTSKLLNYSIKKNKWKLVKQLLIFRKNVIIVNLRNNLKNK